MSARPSPWCFRHRVELACLIGGVGFLFFLLTPVHSVRMAARGLALPEETFVRSLYVFLALWNLAAGALRIWAGGTIGGARMMSVSIRTETLLFAGPYRHVRNPIYLADIMTLSGMALIVPRLGSLLVLLLLALVYPKIVAYEERELRAAFGESYERYLASVPRFGWRVSAYGEGGGSAAFSFSEGLSHNFLYLPLIPGFLTAAFTGRLWHGVAVGAAGPVAWVVLHFWKNFRPGGLVRGGGNGT